MLITPMRGEVWLVDLNQIVGREQAKKRPCLVLSNNLFNEGPAELVIVAPFTSKKKNIPLHIPVHPPEGGLLVTSYVMPEQIRSISIERLSKSKMGKVGQSTLHAIEYTLKILLDL